MANISSDLKRYLAAEGYTGALPDMWRAALQSESGSSLKQLGDLEKAFLAAEGYSGGLNDMWHQYFGDKGYTGSLQDRWKAAIAADDVFASIPLVVVQDTFTNDGASSVNLDVHTPDTDYVGGGWTVTANDGSTFTGTQDVVPADYLDWNGSGFARIDAGVNTVTVRSTYVAGSGNRDHTLLLRRVDDSNFFAVGSRNDTDDMFIEEVTSNSVTLRAFDTTVGASLWTSFYAQDNGTRVSVGVDGGAEAIGYNSADKHGGTEVGYVLRSSLATGTAMRPDEFVCISVADYTQLP